MSERNYLFGKTNSAEVKVDPKGYTAADQARGFDKAALTKARSLQSDVVVQVNNAAAEAVERGEVFYGGTK